MVNPAESSLLYELRRALTEILPTDWSWRVSVQDRPSEADAVLDLTDPRGDITRVRVELKSRLSPAEIVRQLGWYGERGPWLLAAPVVGPRGRQILADENISWIDLATRECRIAFGNLRIERMPARRGSVRITGGGAINVAGDATDPGRRFVADLFSGKALRIVRWLLIDPERLWTLDEMVSAASVSPGFVSRTFATLERDAYMERERGASRLRDADGLLTAWAAAPPPSDRVVSRVSLLPTPQAVLDAVRQLPNAPRYALTAEAAAEQIAPYARFSRGAGRGSHRGPARHSAGLTLGVFAILFDHDGSVLLCHRRDGDLWNLPGGGLEHGEAPWAGVIREVEEETGLKVEVERLAGMYYKPDVNEVIFSFVCNIVGGLLSPTDEADRIEYFAPDRIPPNTSRKQVERIHDAAATSGVALKEQRGPSSWLRSGQVG